MAAQSALRHMPRLLFIIWLILAALWVAAVAIAALAYPAPVPIIWSKLLSLALAPPFLLLLVGWLFAEAGRNWHRKALRLTIEIGFGMVVATHALAWLAGSLRPGEPWDTAHAFLSQSPFVFIANVGPAGAILGAILACRFVHNPAREH